MKIPRQRRLLLAGFYLSCAALYFCVFYHEFIEHWRSPTWFIAPIMAFGSFVAGSTFLGGGSVAFPALTKLLATDPVTAKTFSLAIQSIGMSSASIYIISRTRALPYAFIGLFILGATFGIGFTLALFETAIPPVDLRISFTLFLVCFLVVYLFTRHSTNVSTQTHLENTKRDIFLTLGCGVAGGAVSGLLGSGADLVGFSLLALYFRIDIKRATQISIVLMAATSIIGTAIQGLAFDRLEADVKSLWYIAAPVVLFGAPVGAVFCRRISSKLLLYFICAIVLVEVASTLYLVPIDQSRLIYYGAAASISVLALLFFRHQARIKHD